MSPRRETYVLYTAVLPAYRYYCMDILAKRLGTAWSAYAGDVHLDPSVKTAIPTRLYTPVKNRRLFGARLLLQSGHWWSAIGATTTVLDLNPRSLTAWLLLLIRKVTHRRTLVWGHLEPRKGREARTAWLRDRMRRVADGSILYSYESRHRLLAAEPTTRTWVAPNALYPRRLLHSTANGQRGTILYVGRLEPAKKPGLLLDAFSAIANRQPGWQLEFVGEGSLRDELCANATNHGLETRVSFLGPIYDVEELAPVYARARCSVSPGFVGLTLTQSLGFGVPMAIADREPHSPEIELAREGGAVVFFEQDSAASLALTLESPAFDISDTQRSKLVAMIRERYSAEAMAQGIIEAVTNDLVEPS